MSSAAMKLVGRRRVARCASASITASTSTTCANHAALHCTSGGRNRRHASAPPLPAAAAPAEAAALRGLAAPEGGVAALLALPLPALHGPLWAIRCLLQEVAPDLRSPGTPAARALLAAYVQPTRELVRTLVEMELCRINTQHPDFVGRRMGVGALMAEVAQEMAASRGRVCGAIVAAVAT
ncbi:MAG: hypothetical protein ACK4NM_19350, partial [Hydrogenophaga sp.]